MSLTLRSLFDAVNAAELTRGGPVNATQLMATLSYQRAVIAGQLGETQSPNDPASAGGAHGWPATQEVATG